MIRLILFAILLTSSPVHAEGWCNGILTSDNVCLGASSNVPPVIVRCDYYNSSNNDPGCWRRDQRPTVERRT